MYIIDSDLRGMGCRFLQTLEEEADTCENKYGTDPVTFEINLWEAAYTPACCPTTDGSVCSSGTCDVIIDEATDTWSYPTTNGVTDSCCIYNEYTAWYNTARRGCCSYDVHWEISGCRNSDCPFGRVTTAAMMDNCPDCDVAWINGGSIRHSLGKDTPDEPTSVNFDDLKRVFQFQNYVNTFKVRGDVLHSIFAITAGRYQSYYGQGSYPHLAGARYVFHPGVREILRAEVCTKWDRELDSCVGVWEDPLTNPSKLYKIATSDYVRRGGAGMETALAAPGAELYELGAYGLDFADLVQRYLSERSPYTPVTMQEIKDTCTGFVYNYVEHFKNNPDCRTLKSSIKFPEKCVRGDTSMCEATEANNSLHPLGEGSQLQVVRSTNTSCVQCSGFGTCFTGEGYVCQCHKSLIHGFSFPDQYVLQGESSASTCRSIDLGGDDEVVIHDGITMTRGSDCSDFRSEYFMPGSQVGFSAIMGVICVALGTLSALQTKSKYIAYDSECDQNVIDP